MMARRARNDLDELLEAWARWCVSGSLSSTGRSMLARWMDSRGHITFGGGGGDMVSAMAFPIEEQVEAAVLALASDDLMAADILRLEYNAGAGYVVKRRRMRGYDPRNIRQIHKAHHLGISLRTYHRRLSLARFAVEKRLNDEEITQ